MKYLILIYTNPEMREFWDALTDAQRAVAASAHTAFTDELAASGELVISSPLADVSHAKQVTARDGEVMTTDGPYAEVKEHLAGFYVLECESVERAVQLAGRLPEAEYGAVEVRPTMNPVWMRP
jgi:hypothetical protein